MSHSLRFPSRLLAVLATTVTMIVLAATTAAALVPPPDPDVLSRRLEPVPEAASWHLGLALAVIIATAVVALATAIILRLRTGRTHAGRPARPATSTTR